MSTRVITISVCDRCGKEEERAGAKAESLPTFWSRVTTSVEMPASPNQNATKQLCSPCGDELAEFLRPLPAEAKATS